MNHASEESEAQNVDATTPQAEATAGLGKRDIVERVAELLKVTYRQSDLGNVTEVLSETVYILLSLNAREGTYQQVFAALRKRYPRWSHLHAAPGAELTKALRSCGLQSQRTMSLKALMCAVYADNLERGVGPAKGDDLTLEYLHDFTDAAAESFLKKLPGIGPKSAHCVMAYSLGRDRIAVDTHVERVLTRLGVVPPKSSPTAKIDHQAFQDAIPPKLRRGLHVDLVHHGRAVCGRRASCGSCVLVSFCGQGLVNVAANDERPMAIDLFGGAGGLGSGFSRAGYRVALAVEKERHAAQTYRANNPGVPVIEADVSKLTASRVRALVPGLGEPAAVLAGPPCQGYSSAGTREPTNEKNVLFQHVVSLAENLRSHLVVIENVPGLKRVNGISFQEKILGALRKQYNAEMYELTASSFGVPQNRRRCYFLGRRKDLGSAPGMPNPTHRPPGSALSGEGSDQMTPTLESVLDDEALQIGSGQDAEYVVLNDGMTLLNASTMKHSSSVIEKIKGIQAGKGPISYRRLERDVARTLVAGHRALPVHPWLHRTISVREAARIQGFSDSYVFCGPKAEQPLQVANAVPPAVAFAVGVHLLPLLPGRTPGPSGAPSSDELGAI